LDDFIGKGAHLRPSLDDLLNNIPAKEEDEEDEEDLHAKGGKIIKFGWMDGVLVSRFLPTKLVHFPLYAICFTML